MSKPDPKFEMLCTMAKEHGYIRTKSKVTNMDPKIEVHSLQVSVFGTWMTLCYVEEVTVPELIA